MAQSKDNEPKGDKKISLMIVTEENGQKTIIDTTFTTADEETMRNYLKSRGVNDFDMNFPPPPPPPPPPAPGTPPPPPPPHPGEDREVAYQYEYKIIDGKKGKHDDEKEIHVVVRCFRGTIGEFEKAVLKTHGHSNYGKEYLAFIENAKTSFKIWGLL